MRVIWLGVLLGMALVFIGCPPAISVPGNDVRQGKDTRDGDTGTLDSEGGVDSEAVGSCEGEPDCKTLGVCSSQTVAVCVGGSWTCDYGFEGYEETETSCNGQDNDCDGVADEDETFALEQAEAACPELGEGVCKTDVKKSSPMTKITCAEVDGSYQLVCDFSEVAGYSPDERFYEDPEILGDLCDGKDNDCDGEIDESLDNLDGFDQVDEKEFIGLCKDFLGPCQVMVDDKPYSVESSVAFRCNGGNFECNYDYVQGFEQEETLCDDVDNDCDGEVDEVTAVELSNCPVHGVCKILGDQGLISAVCNRGEWFCSLPSEDVYKAIPGWQAVETLCDGLDNDCDGAVDEGMDWESQLLVEDCTDEVDNNQNGLTDCQEPSCAQYHESCGGTAPLFKNCPVITQSPNGTYKVPVLAPNGRPILPGVCAPAAATLQSNVLTACHGYDRNSDGSFDDFFFLCNYDAVVEYTPDEKFFPGSTETWCDGLDNDCDGVVDNPGDLVVTDQDLYLTPCHNLGECDPCRSGDCDGSTVAQCNADGNSPATWSCQYGVGVDAEELTVEFGDCQDNPENPQCQWTESRCDGLDNDCDGRVDEDLDGKGYGLELACGELLDHGVCNGTLDTVCGQVTGGKGWICDKTLAETMGYAEVEEGNEELCDGLDNDCDGQSDEGIVTNDPAVLAAYTTCNFKGVCAQITTATCQADVAGEGVWSCAYGDSTGIYGGYQDPVLGLREYKCDGLDNDCDGMVDEDLDMDFGTAAPQNKNPKYVSQCPILGVCQSQGTWSCGLSSQGQKDWICLLEGLSGYQAEEARCDGKDNDCDGEVDEELSDPGPGGANCYGWDKGVCAENGVVAECVEETWQCHYEDIPTYEVVEKRCDGKDNDCDGEVDEDLDWHDSTGVNVCRSQGVCETGVLALCSNGPAGWNCIYNDVVGFEQTEHTCDGLDNDCNGAVDQYICGPCKPCVQDDYCLNSGCNSVPGGGLKFCASTFTNCVAHSESSGCYEVVQGEATCMDQVTRATCTMNQGKPFWYIHEECSGSKPICVLGSCKLCVPNRLSCDGNLIVQCDGTGNAQTEVGICQEGYVCVQNGSCVPNDEFQVDTLAAQTGEPSFQPLPRVAGLDDGGFVIVWSTNNQSVDGNSAAILGRIYNANMEPRTEPFLVNQYTTGSQTAPAVASIGNGYFVVVWQSTGKPGVDGSAIAGRIYSQSGDVMDDEFDVNTSFNLSQEEPDVAGFGDGKFIVSWHSKITYNPADWEIRGRIYDSDWVPEGDDFLMNSTTINVQRSSAVAGLGLGGFIGAWTSTDQDAEGTAVVGQIFDDLGYKVLSEFVANIYESYTQKSADVAGLRGVLTGSFVITWDSSQQDLSSTGVYMQIFDAEGPPYSHSQDIKVHQNVVGKQQDSAVAVLGDNQIVVVWESEDIDGNLNGVSSRVFSETGVALTNETMVNKNAVGEQWNPDVAALTNNGYVVVWSSLENNITNIKARMFRR